MNKEYVNNNDTIIVTNEKNNLVTRDNETKTDKKLALENLIENTEKNLSIQKLDKSFKESYNKIDLIGKNQIAIITVIMVYTTIILLLYLTF